MTISPPPRVVCLCGSTAQADTFAEANRVETAAGRIVLAPGCDLKTPHPLWDDPERQGELKTNLDALHRAKIDYADEVVIIAKADGSLGESTRRELAYARQRGKPTRFWAPPHLLEVDTDGTWQLTCTAAPTDPARPCAPSVACGCPTSAATELAPCPHSPTGRHHLVHGRPHKPASGCWLTQHRDLATAVEVDILPWHGPGTHLLAYDTFYDDDLVLSVDATLSTNGKYTHDQGAPRSRC